MIYGALLGTEPRQYLCGGRVWKSQYPENTIEAFEAAITLGVDQPETDVREPIAKRACCIIDDALPGETLLARRYYIFYL